MTKPWRTTAEIPLIMGKPETTSTMKHKCNGEYKVSIIEVCQECYAEEPDPACEVCYGEGEYEQYIVIPWTMCKDIYEQMVGIAIQEQALRELTKLAQENGEYE